MGFNDCNPGDDAFVAGFVNTILAVARPLLGEQYDEHSGNGLPSPADLTTASRGTYSVLAAEHRISGITK